MFRKGNVVVVMLLFFGLCIIPYTGNTTNNAHSNNLLLNLGNIPIGVLACNHQAYAFIAYDPYETFNCSIVKFKLNEPGNMSCIGECRGGTHITNLVSGNAWTRDLIWIVSEYYTGALWKIDIETGDMESIGGGGTGLNSLSYDPINDVLYGCSSNSLYKIDIESGEQEFIGPLGGDPILMIGIAFDLNGILYGWDIGTDNLWTIDTETGNAGLVGPLGIDLNYQQDGAFCYYDDILYLAAYTTSPYSGGYLYECDKDTGDCTLVGQFEGNVQITALVIPYNWPNQPPELLLISGPNYGRPNIDYTFCIEGYDPDGDNVFCMWDWGDGTNTEWLGPFASGETICANHSWSQDGTYIIRVKLKDIYGNESSWLSHEIIIESGIPNVEIAKPKRAIYFRDNKIIPFIIPIIIGDIQIWFSAEDSVSGINHTELYIDNQLKEIFIISPKSWLWNETTPMNFRHVIKLIAYDNAGNNASKKITVWKFL